MKKIRSNFVKESLLDYENLAKTLKENTSEAVKDMLSEAVRETYNQILEGKDEDEYEEEEVEDTDSSSKKKSAKKSSKKSSSKSDLGEDGYGSELDGGEAEMPDESGEQAQAPMNGGGQEPMPEEGEEAEMPMDGGEAEMPEEGEEAEAPMDGEGAEMPEEGSNEDEWASFDKYKVGDDEYDFSEAEDDEIVKVYKLMKDDDQVLVNVDKEAQKVELKDNESGAEYLIDLGSGSDDAYAEETDMDAEGDLEDNYDNMNESRIFEIALNEYDSHVGYTDNYQSKDVMTNPGTSEPGKNVNDWDAGVPKGDSKPWSSRKPKRDDKPFTEEEEMEEVPMEEGAGRFGYVQKHTVAKKHVGQNDMEDEKPNKTHEISTSDKGLHNEAKMVKKVNSIMKENNELKKALGKFKNVLAEAAVTNLNLGQIIKLISENSTTKAEKMEIISRFGKEAKTIAESKKLYESISQELKKNSTMNINEDRQFTVKGSKMINETQIYQSKDLLESLDMMHKICK